MADIFLSYNRDDQATAQCFAEGLEAQGYSVWWDVTLRSGEAYDQVTEDALRSAKAVLVLWSKKSVVSRWVRAEATVADRNGTLLPVRIEPCDLPVMFELTQTADLSHWQGEASDPAWAVFLADVGRKVGTRSGEAELTYSDPVSNLTPASSMGGVPIVAVLPITNRTSDERLQLLAEDLTEDIARELAQNSLFRVMAANIMAAWRDKAIDHRMPGRELGISYLVEGKLQRAGENVRLTLQLIETETGSMVQSMRFVYKLTDIADYNEEFPVSVACELGERITKLETRRAMTKQGSLSGWEHVLRAMAFMERIGPDSERRGLAEIRAAVALAPDLGLAHAALASNIGGVMVYDQGKLDEIARQQMHDHIKRAMQLDGDNPLILNYLVSSYALLGDGEACLGLARRAVELAPNSPVAYFALGHAHFFLGQIAEATTALNEQLRLAQHDLYRPAALMILGACFCLEGKPAEAESALDRSLALNPDFCVALSWKAVVAAQQGHQTAAKEAVLRLRESEPNMTLDDHLRLLVYYPVYQQRSEDAVRILRRLWDETGVKI